MVWAYNEETGQKDLKQVVRLFRNETEEWIHIDVYKTDKDTCEEVVCTPEHPFYILNVDENTPLVRFEGQNDKNSTGNWVAAKDLKSGMKVLLSNGESGIIESIEVEHLEEPEITYNLEVEDYHTYYVGSEGILVHNACGGDVFKNGELFERSFDVNGKTIDILANTRIEGSNLFLDDIVMYARGGDAVNQLGRQGILGIGREINGLAAQQGFKTITYSFTRVANSSSVMKGIPLIWGPFGL